ncbi:DUF7927 domain-containing protein [Microbacterium timonense]|uniref:DUF7927 domain-containing protein n=1 Tax=Microbacterium timonense TaxID=2086576 RepID=UPI00135C8D4A|nr:GEVED domain-containing protein [Microbacterium timonense]
MTAPSAGTVTAWIDFDRDGAYTAQERIMAGAAMAAGANKFTYTVPENAAFVPGASTARFDFTVAGTTTTTNLARTLYDAEGIALGLCPAGTDPVPVGFIQNPSLETRTQDFQNNSSASTISYAQNWFDSHPSGGQYHVFSPTFDSGPVASTQPVRAGADGYGFEGGHSTGGNAGEGAVNTLTAALNPDATYVGFFSMAAGGYGREGNGFVRFFGTNDRNSGSIAPATPQTAANTELLYTTPVVNYAGNGVRPTWQLNTFTLEASQAWPYLRVEVRNATPANDATVAGQVWMNFDDFHMYECEPIQDYGDAPESYGTSLATNGPRHLVPGYDAAAGTAPLMLGTSIDDEDDGFPSADATGDDADNAADEDGVSGPVVIKTGQSNTVTVTATNTSNAAATLAGWVDLNGNGVFEASELVTVPVPANSGTVDYDLTFPAPTTTNDSFARLRLFPGDVTTFLPTGAAAAGEVEDFAVTVQDRALTIAKVSDATTDTRVGDVITYTITATNTGAADYTAAIPARITDDLSAALDDARYNNDAQVAFSEGSTAAAPILDGQTLRWAGPLQAGETVTLTYTITVEPGGDGVVRNSACVPADEADGEPCAVTETQLPRLTISKSADRTDLPANGETVTYTVTITNEGPGDFTAAAPGTATDDLSGVLDDADYNGDATATVGDVTFDAAGERLEWTGVLPSGDTAIIEYSVTYDSSLGGDNQLRNTACLPAHLALDADNPCRVVQIPGAGLQQYKSVNPADGNAVAAGQQVMYTLTFASTGQTAATVDTSDDLSGVLDDATLISGPTASDAGLVVGAIQADGTFTITGAVPAGQTFTVSYTVRVNTFPQQGDHLLENVLQCDASMPDCDPPTTTNPVRHLSVVKSSTPDTAVTGDTVTYQVTVTNDGAADYTVEEPARAIDDLSGVLDDATYNDDAEAGNGTLTYQSPLLTWVGALDVDDSVTFTYTVEVTNTGDHVLRNVASTQACDPTSDPTCQSLVETPLPHVTSAKASDPASGTDVAPGQVITYTLTYNNDGEASGVVDSTDDLRDVLDDADLTRDPETSDPAVTAAVTGETLRISGPIAVGGTVTVTYQVTIRADGDRGDNLARNVLAQDTPELCGDTPCDPPTTEHRMGELDDWKTVDPASGSTVQPGQQVIYTLHFENTGEADVTVDRDDVLTQVLDDATITSNPLSSDPALTVSVGGDRFAVTGVLTAGQLVTVTYTVTVNPDGERGDDRLGNALVPAGTDPDENCVPVDPDRPDCTVNPVSNVVAAKSADPASGTEVSQGQQVTYTLTFRNVSTNPDAADVPIDYTDYLADVLDDATVTAGPTASATSVTALHEGDTIRVTGEVASGETVTVTYTATVKPYDQQGDHSLGNVIAVTGEEPVCAPGSDLCTQHDLVPPPPGLAVTGGAIAWTAGGIAGLLLLVGATTVLIARRRHPQDAAGSES